MRLSPQQEQATVEAYLTMSARLSGIYAEFEVLLAQLSAPAASDLAGEALLASMVRCWGFVSRGCAVWPDRRIANWVTTSCFRHFLLLSWSVLIALGRTE